MYDINDITIGRVNVAVAMIMNEAVARSHKESGYTPMLRFMSILMDINEEVNRGVNERMNKILQEDFNRAKHQRETMDSITAA